MPLFKQDATYYAQEVKAGRLTASQLVDWALENIQALNPSLHAVAHVQAESARAQAQTHDQLWRQLSESERQELPAFFGVPILLKDLGQLQAGEPSYAGAQLMADYIANQTSYFVESIQALGFIVVGRTNVPEFGFKNISDAQFTGAVSYPGDLTRNAGGSSGGAAAALKAGMVPIVTASDGGGSIRIPASFCGLIGLKPSRGRVPVGPDGYRGWQGASVHFALTKSVRDTWTLLEGLQVEQWAAPYMVPRLSPGPLTLPQRPLRIAYLLDSPLTPQVRLDVANLLRQTVERLAGMGHELVPVDFPVDVIAAARDYTTMNAVETVAMMRGFEASLGRALTPDDMEPMTWGIYQAGLPWDAADYSQLLGRWDQLAADMENFFQDYDLLLTPGTNGPAPLHGSFAASAEMAQRLLNQEDLAKEARTDLIMERWQDSWAYTPWTFLQNLAGQPAIMLPLGKSSEGLPLGVQLWAGKGQERVLCQLAAAFEAAGVLETEIIE